MKPKTKQRIKQAAKNITLDILQIISELPALIPDPFESRADYNRRLHFLVGGYSYDQIQKGLYYMEKKDLIKKKTHKNHFTYDLTVSGKQKLLMSNLAKTKVQTKDGYSCIIIFDIPEEKSRHRKFLRRLLLKNGFMNLQRSVMIGPQFFSKEFFELLEDLKLRQNVTVIKGQVQYS